MIRFFYSFAIIALLFFAPWYLVYVVVLVGFVVYRNYAEGVVVAAIVDTVHGNNNYTLTLISCVAFLLAYYTRSQIR